ncbi:MAG TPA: sigma-70 family RNA polymerase sigma factor [Candidatus Sulfopaludibacter sp.]|nr:sigma-70 family RNA polymerase sigma factor [Candidatus Sulfopaludibacter sp.]
MTPDSELLDRYARTRSEDAFAELVRRHINLVYSAALRQVNGDVHLAQDVAQAVFTDLARKAASLARRESLTGWLYTSAHYAAAKIARTEDRRRQREDKYMREPISETAPEADWEKIRPTLDDVMHELKESDREVILLRYFENRQFAEVGIKLGLNENAARMRVERALEKLRVIFVKRGITTAAAVASVISANAVQLAPAGLATTLTTTAAATVGTGTAFTFLKFMTATHIKLGISALVVAGAATALMVQHQTQTRLRAASESLRQQIAQLQADNTILSNRLTAIGEAKTLTDEQFNELLKLRGEVGMLRRQTNEIGALREKLDNLKQRLQSSAENIPSEEQQQQMAMHKMSDAKQAGLLLHMFADDNNSQFPTNFDQVINYLGNTNFTQVFSNEFGIVYKGSLTNIANPSSAIVVQEHEAWPTYDGKWAKVYGFADGHAQLITQPDNDFSSFEQQHRVVPSGNQ